LNSSAVDTKDYNMFSIISKYTRILSGIIHMYSVGWLGHNGAFNKMQLISHF